MVRMELYLFEGGRSVMRSARDILERSLFHMCVEMIEWGALSVRDYFRFLTFGASFHVVLRIFAHGSRSFVPVID